MPLTRKQVSRGMIPVRPDRIEELRGLSYIPAEEVRAELIRQFGIGNWDSQVVDLELLFANETKTNAGKPAWFVGYKAGVRLRIRDYDGFEVAEFVEYHVGVTTHPDLGEAHANAMTSASSYALRRCAIGLGDNYGLHLYHKGQAEALVKGTLQLTEHLPEELKDAAPKDEEAPAEEPAVDPAAADQARTAMRKAFTA